MSILPIATSMKNIQNSITSNGQRMLTEIQHMMWISQLGRR